jgi:mycothiol synthase
VSDVLSVEVRRPVAPDDTGVVRRLVDAAEHADGRPPLGDSVWRDLAGPDRASALVVASTNGEPVGALHLAPPENDDDGSLNAAFVVDPAHRNGSVEHALLQAAVADPRVDGHRILLWVFGADDHADDLATAHGFDRQRELYQMRVPLPLLEDPTWPEGIAVRTFRPGIDEDAWLAVNNRAFADDPDQHGWTRETLLRREGEAWFDPAWFLTAWHGDALAGFCWTRLHPPTPPHEPHALGEIYVIAVDPGHQGIGLGRALVEGGLASLHARGAPLGMLFVDAVNTGAVKLYEKLGFTVSRVDRAYVREPA